MRKSILLLLLLILIYSCGKSGIRSNSDSLFDKRINIPQSRFVVTVPNNLKIIKNIDVPSDKLMLYAQNDSIIISISVVNFIISDKSFQTYMRILNSYYLKGQNRFWSKNIFEIEEKKIYLVENDKENSSIYIVYYRNEIIEIKINGGKNRKKNYNEQIFKIIEFLK